MASQLPLLIRDLQSVLESIVQADDAAGTQALLEKWGHLDGAGRALMSAAALACFKNRFQIENTARELLELIASSATKAASPDAPVSNH